MYTLEMYPALLWQPSRFYPPDEVIGRETLRNRSAVLYLIDVAGCLYSPIGKVQTDCGPFYDDFELSRGWQVNPLGDDTAYAAVAGNGRDPHRRTISPGRRRPVDTCWSPARAPVRRRVPMMSMAAGRVSARGRSRYPALWAG